MTVVHEYKMRAHKRAIYSHECAWVAPLAIAIGTKTVLHVDDSIDIHICDRLIHMRCIWRIPTVNTHTHNTHTHTHTHTHIIGHAVGYSNRDQSSTASA